MGKENIISIKFYFPGPFMSLYVLTFTEQLSLMKEMVKPPYEVVQHLNKPPGRFLKYSEDHHSDKSSHNT